MPSVSPKRSACSRKSDCSRPDALQPRYRLTAWLKVHVVWWVCSPPRDGAAIARGSAPSAIKKCYQRLVLLLHPDKLPARDDAERAAIRAAFQHCMDAREELQRADDDAAEPDAAAAARAESAAIARSNENCFRTAFACPRCKVEFNWPSSGNPDYYYNFFMQSAPRRAR